MSQAPAWIRPHGRPNRGPDSAGPFPGLDESGALAFAIVLSVLVHLIIGWQFYDRTFGRIDPRLLGQEREVFRVQRASEDLIVEEAGAGPLGTGAITGRGQPQLSELGAALLAGGGRPDQPRAGSAPAAVEMRKVPDAKPANAAGEAAVSLPDFQVPEALRDKLQGQPPLGLSFVEEKTTGAGDGLLGEGDGTAGGVGGRAGKLLAGAGLRSGRNPQALRSERTGPAEQAPTGSLTGPVTSPPIDFGGLADASKQLPAEHLDDDFEYILSTFEPKRSPDDGMPGYFRLDVRPKPTLRRLPAMPKDVVFVIDTSGSVEQIWVTGIAVGVRDALASLNRGDRFNIVFFKETPAFFSTTGVREATDENIAAARQFLAGAQSGGYTDVNQAISRLLVRDVAVQRVYNLVLISDGRPTRGVMDTRELINLITRDNDLAASIYCVGVGDRPNQQLLEFLAYRNKGFCLFAPTPQQVPDAVRDLASQLRYPIIKNPQLSIAGQEPQHVYPRTLPDLHQGQTLTIYGRYGQPGPITVQVAGRNAAKLVDFTVTRDLRQAAAGDASMMTQWAFWKLHHLYSLMLQSGQNQAAQAEIERLQKEYGIKTLY